MRIGLIADTHGVLRPAAVTALTGCDHIVHAGDIGTPEVLEALALIAPVSAVRGNNDRGAWADALPLDEVVSVGALLIYVLHDRAELDLDAAAAGFHVVVTGHSHRPSHEIRDGVHYINPGSAGPRRFHMPVTVAELNLQDGAVAVNFVTLDPGASGPT